MKNKNPRLNGGFGFTTKAVMADPELSMKEKGLYAYLATYADGTTNELRVSVNRMCAELGVTQATIKRSLKLLEERGVIKRINTGVLQTRRTILLK
jgi:DNA-binding MarR family transcriptional regulator